jgi:hypothetical protein
MRMILAGLSSILHVDLYRLEFKWNVAMGVVVGSAGIVFSALVLESTMPRHTLFKLAASIAVILLGIVLSTKPLMTFCTSIPIVAVRWLLAALVNRSFTAVIVVIALVAIIWVLVKFFPEETGAR